MVTADLCQEEYLNPSTYLMKPLNIATLHNHAHTNEEIMITLSSVRQPDTFPITDYHLQNVTVFTANGHAAFSQWLIT